MNISERINSFHRDDYQRDNFDSFLKKVGFSFSIPAIHIGGTNGKTMTAKYIANIYACAGYKVGLFTSFSYQNKANEMISINGKEIDDSDIEKIFDEYEKMFKKYELSSFEIQTFIAFKYFQNSGLDICVIECGIGGENDATNIFKPILSIITNVSIEHTDVLGVSLSEIALQKAGIIKRDVPVLLGNIEGDALDVIVKICRENSSKAVKLSQFQREILSEEGLTFDYGKYSNLKIYSKARANVTNARLAIEAVLTLYELFEVKDEVIYSGLLLPIQCGNFEVKRNEPLFIIDGAHNPDAIVILRDNIDRLGVGGPFNIVFASFKDKNITKMLPEIAVLGKLNLTSFDNPRCRNEDDYFLYLSEYDYSENHIELIKKLMMEEPETPILVTGSLEFARLVSKEFDESLFKS